jgi:hypothetical protein
LRRRGRSGGRNEGETQEPHYVKDTLDWCNERRKEQGKEPLKKLPKGKIGDGYTCPCGKATGLYVGTRGWDVTQEEYDDSYGGPNFKRNPESVKEFVRAFDQCKLPQYLAKTRSGPKPAKP